MPQMTDEERIERMIVDVLTGNFQGANYINIRMRITLFAIEPDHLKAMVKKGLLEKRANKYRLTRLGRDAFKPS